MNINKIILLSLIPLSSAIYAADGEITITGRVLDTTCTLGGSSGDYTVTLPTVGKTALSAANDTAGDTVFTIVLTTCPVSTGISAFFDNTIVEVNDAGRLKNMATSDKAENVDIELLNSARTAMDLKRGTAVAQLSTKLPSATASSNINLEYTARYYATAAVTQGGDVSTRAVYTIIYD